MKKIISVIYAAALALSLCGCDKADDNSESNLENGGGNFSSVSNESTYTVSTEQNIPVVPSAGADPIMLTKNDTPCYGWEHSCETEDGVYYIKEAYNSQVGTYGYLMYLDYATGQETFLCSDSSCNHNTERCSSYLSNDEFFVNTHLRLFEYNGSLYYLNLDTSKNEDTVQINGSPYVDPREQSLYRMSIDGSNRELLYTFGRELIVESFAAGDGNALWFFIKTPTIDYDEERKAYFFGTKDPTLIKFDLSERGIVEQIPLYKYKELERVFVWSCSEEKMIFCGREFPEGITRQDVNAMTDLDDPAANSIRIHELNERCQSVYFTLDLNNKNIKEIYRHKYGINNEYMGFAEGKYAYFTDTGERTSVRVNIDNGEQSEFSPAEGYVAVKTINGKYACISIDKDDPTVYYVDKNSGEITSNGLRSLYLDEDWMTLYGDIYEYKPIGKDVAAFGKDCVLICSKHNPGYLNFDYVLMSLDDYFNGRAEYRPIKTVFQGVVG